MVKRLKGFLGLSLQCCALACAVAMPYANTTTVHGLQAIMSVSMRMEVVLFVVLSGILSTILPDSYGSLLALTMACDALLIMIGLTFEYKQSGIVLIICICTVLLSFLRMVLIINRKWNDLGINN